MRGVGAVLAVGMILAGAGCGSRAVDPVQAAREDVRTLEKAVQAYCIQKGEYPDSLDVLVTEDLLTTADLRDPWRGQYKYDPAGKKNKGKKPDIWTVSPDRKTIGNWADGRR